MIRFLALPLLMLLGPGCATIAGGPDPLENQNIACNDDETQQSPVNIRPELDCINFNWMTEANTDNLLLQRNNVITLRMLLIERKYNSWERTMLNEVKQGNFLTTLGLLGLGSVSAVIKQDQTTKALAASSTLLVGAQQSFDRDILFDRTIPILIARMRASRAKAKETIFKRLNTPYLEWPIGLALMDLEALESSGTINSALVDLAETASNA